MNIQEFKQDLFMFLTLALVASYCWLTFGGNRELVYMMVPLAGLLSQIGGTWKKQFRRFIIPTMLTTATIAFLGWNWWWVAIWPAYFGFASLPFTLVGDSFNDSPLNFLWVILLGFIAWSCSFIFAIATHQVQVWLLLLPWTLIGYSLPGIMSNSRFLAMFFEWKLCEALFYSSILIQACCLISWAK